MENRFKKSQSDQSKPGSSEPGKGQTQAQRTRDITCFKCQGKGHYARDCPNKRVMILKADGEYESQDEADVEMADSGDEIVDYAETGGCWWSDELSVLSLIQRPSNEKTSSILDVAWKARYVV